MCTITLKVSTSESLPYISEKDRRLKVGYEGYAVSEREARDIHKTQRNMMLLSAKTRLGLTITCKIYS